MFTGDKVMLHWHPSMGSIAGAEHEDETGSAKKDQLEVNDIDLTAKV